MSQELQVVLLSLGTSLIVSIVTFVLGLKSGKNQVDRAKLQEIYKKVYSHFSDIKESLLKSEPRQWENYKKEGKSHSYEYLPLVKELNKTGDIIFLRGKIATEATALEEKILNYSWDLKRHIPDIHKALISNLELYCDGFGFDKHHSDRNSEAYFETSNPTNCNSFFIRNYYIFYNKELFKGMLEDIKKHSSAIEFSKGNPIEFSFKLFPESLNVGTEEYINHIFSNFKLKIPEYENLCNEQNRLIKEIDVLNKKIKRRAREPISFWEIFFGAFADMFH